MNLQNELKDKNIKINLLKENLEKLTKENVDNNLKHKKEIEEISLNINKKIE